MTGENEVEEERLDGYKWQDKMRFIKYKSNSIWTQLFYWESDQTLEQVAQRSCGVSADIKNLTRHSLVQSDKWSYLIRELGLMNTRGPFQP